MELGDLVRQIATIRERSGHPIVVGISGYGGSGKSTLARDLVQLMPNAVRMRGDDFLDPAYSHHRSPDWDGVERTRLVNEVLAPFRKGQSGTFRRYDWSARALGAPEELPSGDVMVVDLIGLFHPDTQGALDLKVWCDVPLDTATSRGLARDAALGRDHVDLWHRVWVPNEQDFDRSFQPREAAEVRWVN